MISPSFPEMENHRLQHTLAPDGLIARHFPHFELRPQQAAMLDNVWQAYRDQSILLIEAGTGTGKSLAYLIPALLWADQQGERTVIATHTIALQEQLVKKDIPALIHAMKLPLKVALVKGMNQYICLRKLEERQLHLPIGGGSPYDGEVEKIAQWCKTTEEGSKGELPWVPSAQAWEQVGAESEACPRQECPHFQRCHFFRARRQAHDAHLLVVNHHLLLADIAKRVESCQWHEAAILPSYKRVVIDEAHHLEAIATETLAHRLSRRQLLRDLARLATDKPGQRPSRLFLLQEKLISLFPRDPPSHLLTRLTIELPALRHTLHEQIHRTFETLTHFLLSKQGGRGGEIGEQKHRLHATDRQEAIWQKDVQPSVEQLIGVLATYSVALEGLEMACQQIEHERFQEQTKGLRLEIQGHVLRLEQGKAFFHRFFCTPVEVGRVQWMEMHRGKWNDDLQLIDAQLDVAPSLSTSLFSAFSTVVLCSATLTSNQQFTYVRQRLGLTAHHLPERIVSEHSYPSPFDYGAQVLLAVPTDLPPPHHPHFNEASFKAILRAIEVSEGHAFVLFTSYAMLQACDQAIGEKLRREGYTLFKQGDLPRQALLEGFKQEYRSVLFGTDSFWEGIDVMGDALRCVILVKLPFKVPNEPLIEARTEAILARGGEPFFEYAVPQAVVKFKQGFGRLMRHSGDRGCIVCLDNRLVSKGYGKAFLNSLPSCQTIFSPSTQVWEGMDRFYRAAVNG